MTTIDRHVVKTFLSSYIMLLLVGIGLYVFLTVLFNLDEFTEEPGLTAVGVLLKIADYHGYKLPLYFHQLGGVTMAFAAAFTLAMMLRNNELTPLVAAGVPLQRLSVPILLCSIGLMAAWLVNSEVILPACATKIARHYDDLTDQRSVSVRCVRDDHNAILSASELHSRPGWLRGVYVIEPDAQGVPATLIMADEAVYQPERHTWELRRGTRLVMGAAFDDRELGSGLRREPLDEYPFTLSPPEIQLRQSAQWAELMSIRQMNTLLQSRNLPNLPAVARARDIRFTQPLLIWILMVLAMPYFLTREPANVLVAGGKALLLCGVCFGFTFLAHQTSSEVRWSQLATALPVLVFGPVAVLHMANAKT